MGCDKRGGGYLCIALSVTNYRDNLVKFSE